VVVAQLEPAPAEKVNKVQPQVGWVVAVTVEMQYQQHLQMEQLILAAVVGVVTILALQILITEQVA
jgi:hypothetical protein